MTLPFSQSAFLDVFGEYNSALWPVVLAVWLATFVFSLLLLLGRTNAVTLSAFLAFHWAWEAIAYHAAFFSRINPAAWLFAALFAIQAVLFWWFAFGSVGPSFDRGLTRRHIFAAIFIGYSLLYPLLVVASGHQFPRAPAFAVPCPTALFTSGILLAMVPPVSRWLFVVPVIWSMLGGTAALTLGMTPDLMLFVAAACLLIYAIAPGIFGGSAEPSRV